MMSSRRVAAMYMEKSASLMTPCALYNNPNRYDE